MRLTPSAQLYSYPTPASRGGTPAKFVQAQPPPMTSTAVDFWGVPSVDIVGEARALPEREGDDGMITQELMEAIVQERLREAAEIRILAAAYAIGATAGLDLAGV